jgi:hypothetical protein
MSRREKAKRALEIISGFYPAPAASDARAFLAAAGMMLEEYSDEIIEQFAHPTKGIAADCKFFPNLAEMREWLKACGAEHSARSQKGWRDYAEEIWAQRRLEGPITPPIPRRSFRAELCEQYGISEIPRGWDAVDLCHAKARYRENFHDEIAKALDANLAPPRKPSLYDGMIAKAKAAMEARQAASRETPPEPEAAP